MPAEAATNLSPLTLTRDTGELTLGARTLAQRQAALNDLDGLAVNPHWLCDAGPLRDQAAALTPGQRLVDDDGIVIASRGDTEDVAAAEPARLIRYPWDLLVHQADAITEDLAGVQSQAGLPPHVTVLGDHAITLGADVALSPHVVIDTRQGPVHLGDRTQVNPMCVIEGPVVTGADCVLSPHTHLRGPVTLGRFCKVGGELKGCIVGDYSNKAHYGYLGDAVVGRWCNLGAGTTVSNLKNTYGEVRMQLDGGPATPATPTGRQFQGPVLGDCVRTAIGSRLLTGSVVGPGVCLATSAFAPKHVPPMRFITDAGDTPMDPDAFTTTLQRVHARRGLNVDPTYLQRFLDLIQA